MSEPPEKSNRKGTWAFLREIRTLQAVLSRDNTVKPGDIPVLQEVLEDRGEAPPTERSTPYHDENFDREIFIQEVIDTMMPEVEAELRRRLLALDADVLQRWHRHGTGVK